MKKVFNLIFSLLFYLLIIWGISFLDNPVEYACFSLVLVGIILGKFVKAIILSVEKLFSPLSLFTCIYDIYTIIGISMWIYRELYSYNWEGSIFYVMQYFVGTSIILTNLSLFILSSKKSRDIETNFRELLVSKWKFIGLLLMEYVGIYLYTAGFKIIPILQSDIDIARFELANTSRTGAGTSAILIYCGILCLVYLFYASKYLRNIRFMFILISFLPFLAYGGRLNMFIPILLILLLYVIKKKYVIKLRFIGKITVFFIVAFVLLMLYGTYRQQGDNLNEETFVDFFTADFFPEFRGAVAAYHMNRLDLTLPYISYCIAMLIPGFVAPFLGINKGTQLAVGGYIANLLGYEGFGIRTSITGELLLTNPLSYIIWGLLIFAGVYFLNERYFNYKCWGVSKIILLFLGIYYSLIIPYGITLFPNIIMMIIFMWILKKIIYK